MIWIVVLDWQKQQLVTCQATKSWIMFAEYRIHRSTVRFILITVKIENFCAAVLVEWLWQSALELRSVLRA